ncbi:hypothetical protein HanXRQr2_Chr05g0227921 [Helianthus annuus]|uniref:Uncharacterized protein n=1 Tax=Helianthus annuus TaxID=4232 RepID=A0A251USP4_HELAN|nr:hypothetical protein HanXRQr2_Chr05g0227921 [Helianthus annuus]
MVSRRLGVTGVPLGDERGKNEFSHIINKIVEMDMIGWFCWWHDDTSVVRQ